MAQAHTKLEIDWVKTCPGAMELVFPSDLRRRWHTLKLLDDDYVQSLVTQLVSESDLKQSLA